jgi:porin
MGWHGLTFFSNQFQIHGTGNPGRTLVGNIITISNIEALPSTRLSEIWFEQKLFGDKASLRIGQLTTDSEFFNSRYFTLFISSDWPTLPSVNLPGGGPAYPLSTPGVRLRFEPTPNSAVLIALFNGDPAGTGAGASLDAPDPELFNRTGLNFRVNDPPLLIAEWQAGRNLDKSARGLATILRLGGYHHFGSFEDQRFGADGRSLADPAGNQMARRLRGSDAIYAVIDQQLYRPAGGDADSGIGVFSRISAAPSDRNPIDFYLDGGIVFSGMLPSRPQDKFGATFIYANISGPARALDRDRVAFTGLPYPIRDYEMTLEFTYQAQIVPGWTVQPVLQHTFHPGGHVPLPGTQGPAIRDATVFGARTVINY